MNCKNDLIYGDRIMTEFKCFYFILTVRLTDTLNDIIKRYSEI